MKTLLRFFIVISTIGAGGSVTIACKSNQSETEGRVQLWNMIIKVKKFITDEIEKEKITSIELEDLINGLSKAEEIYNYKHATKYDYIFARKDLNSYLKEYEEPGYKRVKNELSSWIKKIKEEIKKNNPSKPPFYYKDDEIEIFEKLEQSLKKAEQILEDEDATTIDLSLTLQILVFWFYEYNR